MKRTISMRAGVTAVAFAMLATAGAAHAQPTGFVLGVHSVAAPGVTITGEDIDGPAFKTKFGWGGGVMVGYGFNRILTAFVSADVAKQPAGVVAYGGTFGLANIAVGARANLPMGTGTTTPYLTASYGRRGLAARVTDHEFDDRQYDFKLEGSSFGFGGGIEHVISPTLSLDAGFDMMMGRFSHYDIDGDSGALDVDGNTTMRGRLGLTWRPARKQTP